MTYQPLIKNCKPNITVRHQGAEMVRIRMTLAKLKISSDGSEMVKIRMTNNVDNFIW